MSSSPHLLEAHPNDRVDLDAEVKRLRREIVGLEDELEQAKRDALEARTTSKEAIHAIRALRKSPLAQVFTVLKLIFGEVSSVDVGDLGGEERIAGPSSTSTPNAGVWAERIAKAKPTHAKVLQVLLDGGGGPMKLNQIRQAAKTSSNTSVYLNELQAKNWVQKVGHGEWALK